MPQHHSEDYQLASVRHYLTSHDQTQTCLIFGCSERSLMRWVSKYLETGEIKRKKRNYHAYKVKQEHVDFIKVSLIKDRTMTMHDLTDKLNNHFKTDLSYSHISSVVMDNNITLKQTRLRHEPKTRFGKSIDINSKIKEFYGIISQYNLDNIICVDETSLNSYEVRKHCYSDLGKRCVIKTTSQEVFKKYTGIFAISSHGLIDYEIYEKGGITSDRMIEFLNRKILCHYHNQLIILDNASSHRNQRVKDTININNQLLYSVPYQHYTNAIEQYFSLFKSRLRKYKGIGLRELRTNVNRVIEGIPTSIYQRLFNGSYKRNTPYVSVRNNSNRKRVLKTYKNIM